MKELKSRMGSKHKPVVYFYDEEVGDVHACACEME